jgi:uncharacterized membrane protein YfcA
MRAAASTGPALAMDGAAATAVTILLGGSIGILQGVLGAGGAILTIPALVHVLGIPLETATVTSLVVTLANAATGSFQAWRARRMLPRTGAALGVIGVAGAFGGAWLHRGMDDAIVLALFSAVMMGAAATMARRRAVIDSLVPTIEHLNGRRLARLVAVGTAVGLMTGFFGVGGGFLLVPALVTALGVPMRMAPGTSMMAIALNSSWGLAAHLGDATVDPTIAMVFGTASVLGVTVGGRVAGRVGDERLRQAFAVLVAALAIFTLMRDLPALVALLSAPV